MLLVVLLFTGINPEDDSFRYKSRQESDLLWMDLWIFQLDTASPSAFINQPECPPPNSYIQIARNSVDVGEAVRLGFSGAEGRFSRPGSSLFTFFA